MPSNGWASPQAPGMPAASRKLIVAVKVNLHDILRHDDATIMRGKRSPCRSVPVTAFWKCPCLIRC